MGKDGFTFVFLGESGHIGFGLGTVSEHDQRSLFDGPFKMVVADLFVRMPGPFAIGLFSSTD